MVAVYRGKLLRTYYSSTCGGRTAPLEEIWFEREPAPYLRGVIDGPGRLSDPDHAWCRASPRFEWRQEWSTEAHFASIIAALAVESGRSAADLGRLHNVEITKRGQARRAFKTRFHTDGGEVDIGGDRVRWVLRRVEDGGILRSTWFNLDVELDGGLVTAIVANGRGFGHGIGMCQWGTMGMAKEGYNSTQILKHYYPGARLRQASPRLLDGRRE